MYYKPFTFANFAISNALAKLKLAHTFGSIYPYVYLLLWIQNLLRAKSYDSQIFLNEINSCYTVVTVASCYIAVKIQ